MTLLDTILFHGSALSVLPFWTMMICFPDSHVTLRLIRSPLIAVPAALCYAVQVLLHLPDMLSTGGFPSPETLAIVMGTHWAATMYWAYAGAFDLLVGRWMFLEAHSKGVGDSIVTKLSLFIAIFFGPLGFLLFLAMSPTT